MKTENFQSSMKTAMSMIGPLITRFCLWDQYQRQLDMVTLFRKVGQAKAAAFCSQFSQGTISTPKSEILK